MISANSRFFRILGLTLVVGACSGGSGGGGPGNNSNTKDTGGGGCTAVSIAPDATSGGCRIRLVTPNFCDVVDLTNGKTYEVAWTTDGTTCETPWQITVAGEPATAENMFTVKINTNGETITQKGGVIYIDATSFGDLKSSNGQFHWTVASYYGSRPASKNFVVKK